MANPKPQASDSTGNKHANASGASNATQGGSAPSASATTQEIDNLYDRLNSISISLKKLEPTMPPEEIEAAEARIAAGTAFTSVTKSLEGVDSAAASPKGEVDAKVVNEQEPVAMGANKCDPECACQRVLLEASPAACGLCGGWLNAIAQLDANRAKALEDLEVAGQRINELAHEKARHVDYIADLEARIGAQARKIDEQRDFIADLKNDLSAMNDKFVDQVNMTAEISHSRELVEAELEDLTQKLFSEANEMVATEKKARFEAEKTSAHLQNIIADLETRLANETMQSQELKERIEKMSAEYDDLMLKRTFIPSRRGSVGSHTSDALALDGSSITREASGMMSPGAGIPGSAQSEGFRLSAHTAAIITGTKSLTASPVTASPIRLDDVLLSEFREFAEQAQSGRSNNCMGMPFVKHVISEDIEPCLRFGPHPRISSRNVLDAVASNRLQIEEMTPQVANEMRRLQQVAERPNGHRQAMLWERFSGSVASNPNGCQACGRECQCTYRFHMGLKADTDWIQIDTLCRDRLVAACEFYGFIRYLRQGIFASRSIMDMYQETIRLRLCMFYARIGAYAYATDIDPTLSETALLPRSGVPAQIAADLQSDLHAVPSPISVPYIQTGRPSSTASVNRLTPVLSPLQFSSSADDTKRNRSQSEGISPISNTVSHTILSSQ
ncbi:hypothetical protein GGI12_004216 [Dipsacomyces acuminosporus]|nr:hypothetical protein GGI12_004216 [Dipsacomyces acuminosporus]